MKHLLIVYHSKTGHTDKMAAAVLRGAQHPDIEQIAVRMLKAHEADAQDLLWADGLLLGTPENFGYMSGALKDFFDRTFYEVEGQLAPLPYSIFVAAGNDGSGAVRAIQRIANGYPFSLVQDPVICRGDVDPDSLLACETLGTAMAAGIELGMY